MGLRDGIAWAAERALAAARALSRDHVDGGDDADQAGPGEGVAPEQILPSTVWIRYESDAGGVSQRTVTLREAWRRGPRLYLRGWCHMRRKVLTFQAGRIDQLVCLATGAAPADPMSWIEQQALFAGDKDDRHTPDALRRARDELALLAYLGRSDGTFDADEIEVAIDHVAMSADPRIDRARCAAYIQRLAPDPEDLPVVLRRVAADGDRWERLRRSAMRLLEADGKISAGEEVAWRYVDARHEEAVAARQAEFIGMIARSQRGGAIVMDFGGMILAAEPPGSDAVEETP